MDTINDSLKKRTDLLKNFLDNRCYFCENEFEIASGISLRAEVATLPLCKTCFFKHNLNRQLIKQKNEEGKESYWFKECIDIVSKFYRNRCYFCENNVSETDKENINVEKKKSADQKEHVWEILFEICNSSCWSKFQMLELWDRRMLGNRVVNF